MARAMDKANGKKLSFFLDTLPHLFCNLFVRRPLEIFGTLQLPISVQRNSELHVRRICPVPPKQHNFLGLLNNHIRIRLAVFQKTGIFCPCAQFRFVTDAHMYGILFLPIYRRILPQEQPDRIPSNPQNSFSRKVANSSDNFGILAYSPGIERHPQVIVYTYNQSHNDVTPHKNRHRRGRFQVTTMPMDRLSIGPGPVTEN